MAEPAINGRQQGIVQQTLRVGGVTCGDRRRRKLLQENGLEVLMSTLIVHHAKSVLHNSRSPAEGSQALRRLRGRFPDHVFMPGDHRPGGCPRGIL
jgi:hypothetical protein